MDDPANPLGWVVWRRGAALGLRLVLVFFGAAALLYVVLGPLDWPGAVRVLCAMIVGPVLAVVGIAVWWAVRCPQSPGSGDAAFDPDSTAPNRPTLLVRPQDQEKREESDSQGKNHD